MEVLLAALVLAVIVVSILLVAKVRQRTAAAHHRAETERLAELADAEHEGAMTRHEGGA